MPANPEYRARDDVEVAVLDALVERVDEGMSVLEIRAAVDADIDAIEAALAALKDDELIRVDRRGRRTRIHPADRVVPDPSESPPDDADWLGAIRERLGL